MHTSPPGCARISEPPCCHSSQPLIPRMENPVQSPRRPGPGRLLGGPPPPRETPARPGQAAVTWCCRPNTNHETPTNGNSGAQPPARRCAARRSPKRDPARRRTHRSPTHPHPLPRSPARRHPAARQQHSFPPERLQGLLEPVARKAGTAGSERAGAQQCAPATRLLGGGPAAGRGVVVAFDASARGTGLRLSADETMRAMPPIWRTGCEWADCPRCGSRCGAGSAGAGAARAQAGAMARFCPRSDRLVIFAR